MAKTTDAGLSRRKMMLIAGGAVAGAGALIAAPYREAIKSVARNTTFRARFGLPLPSLSTAGYDVWLSAVGSTFSLGSGTNVQLVGVRALPTYGSKPQGVRSQGFAAFFDPAGGQRLTPDIIYTATNSLYGPTPLYLAATSDPRTPRRMVAVFN